MVPAVVVILSISIVLTIGKVVLFVVAHKISHGEAVVGCDEVHRASQFHWFAAVKIWAAFESLGQ